MINYTISGFDEFSQLLGDDHTREWARQSQMTLAYHSKGFSFWVGGRAQTHTSLFLLALWLRCFLQLSCTVLTRVPQEIWGLARQWQTSLLLAFHWWGSPWAPSGRSGLGKVVRVDVGEQLAGLCRILRLLCSPYSTVRTQEPRVGFLNLPLLFWVQYLITEYEYHKCLLNYVKFHITFFRKYETDLYSTQCFVSLESL